MLDHRIHTNKQETWNFFPPLGQWSELLKDQFQKEYFRELMDFLDHEYKEQEIYPPKEFLFNALELTPPKQVKVLILGQDPYHEPGQAHGLAFSVQEGIKIPPSLKNIFKELNTDLGIQYPYQNSKYQNGLNGNLESWAKQGVLLLNTVLSVRAHQANSHKNKGWETFTDAIITEVNQMERPIAVVLWGNQAQKKKGLFNNPRHFILSSAHPSPLSAHRGFLGSRPFSQINKFLLDQGISPIQWGQNPFE